MTGRWKRGVRGSNGSETGPGGSGRSVQPVLPRATALGSGLLACVAVLVLAAGCKRAGGREEAGKGDDVIAVEVEPARLRDVVQRVYLAGEVQADVEVKVLSLMAERILRIYFEEGQEVKKGDLLAIIKAGPLYDATKQAKAGLKAARTQLQLAKQELDRTRKLFKSGAVPLAALQRAEAQYEAAEAQVAQMKAMLAQTYSNMARLRITAPVSGVIGQKFLNEGDIASPQMPLCTIVKMDRVRVRALATELDLVVLKKGQRAKITVPAYPHRHWEGQVNYISPVLDPRTRTATVTVLVDNPDHALRPGMFADVEVETGRRSGVVMVPARAVMRDVAPDMSVRHLVYVLQGDRVRARSVELGVRQGRYVEIRSGLRAGEVVVTWGVFRLRDGMRVKVVRRKARRARVAGSRGSQRAAGPRGIEEAVGRTGARTKGMAGTGPGRQRSGARQGRRAGNGRHGPRQAGANRSKAR